MATTTTPSALVPKANVEHPEFTTEGLTLDVESARDLICATLGGVTATDTADGVKFRTSDGSLVAILTGTHYEAPAVELHYRTAPPSESATLKARKVWRALKPYAD
ncbi:MAG: hypothetical protein ABEJ28_08065 [Salinigranum sp.]